MKLSNLLNRQIIEQYQRGNLLEKINSSLNAVGKELSSINSDDLIFMDELHIGGRKASRDLAKTASFESGTSVLDVGCGIGGPARMLAEEFGCSVTGLDITEEFCSTAEELTRAMGLASKVKFINANALDMPFSPGEFDAVWTQHCSMNIKDKPLLFSEFSKVLRKKGKLVIHDITAGPNPPVEFPVPWAKEQSVSFLITEDEMLSILENSGFKTIHRKNISEQALNWFKGQNKPPSNTKPPPLTQKLVYGDTLKKIVSNMRKNLEEERIGVVEAVLEKC